MERNTKIILGTAVLGAAVIALALLAYALTQIHVQTTSQQPQTPPAPNETPASNGTIGITPTGAAPGVAEAEQTWALITMPNVEKACLALSKKEAVAQGYGDWVVSGCGCTVLEASAVRKAYDCKVSALDGTHPVSVDCGKSLKSCTIVSEKGTTAYTFEQLQAMAGP
jgi:hypothetical protein